MNIHANWYCDYFRASPGEMSPHLLKGTTVKGVRKSYAKSYFHEAEEPEWGRRREVINLSEDRTGTDREEERAHQVRGKSGVWCLTSKLRRTRLHKQQDGVKLQLSDTFYCWKILFSLALSWRCESVDPTGPSSSFIWLNPLKEQDYRVKPGSFIVMYFWGPTQSSHWWLMCH